MLGLEGKGEQEKMFVIAHVGSYNGQISSFYITRLSLYFSLGNREQMEEQADGDTWTELVRILQYKMDL